MTLLERLAPISTTISVLSVGAILAAAAIRAHASGPYTDAPARGWSPEQAGQLCAARQTECRCELYGPDAPACERGVRQTRELREEMR